MSWATRPKAIIARSLYIDLISEERKFIQVFISVVVGKFFGGTQRTALVIRQLINDSPSLGCPLYCPFDKLNLRNAA